MTVRARILLVGVLLALGAAAPAQAGVTVSAASGGNQPIVLNVDAFATRITLGGPPPGMNGILISSPDGFLLDPTASGCTLQSLGSALCTTTFRPYVSVLYADPGATTVVQSIDASTSPLPIHIDGAMPAHVSLQALGSPFDDTLVGGDGAPNDLTGGAGADLLAGGSLADTLRVADSEVDAADCGGGADTAFVDTTDIPTSCETLVFDVDGDGANTLTDCNDHDPAIKPGAIEILGNAVDENCDGVAAPFPPPPPPGPPDLDGDGSPAGADCDDHNAKIKPGAVEIIGNKIDENCDRIVARPPVVILTWGVGHLRTGVKRAAITRAPAGATIALRCASSHGGCPFSKKTVKVKKAGTVELTSLFKKRKLKPGTVITVQITAPNLIGRKAIYTVRRGKTPSRKLTCHAPDGVTDTC